MLYLLKSFVLLIAIFFCLSISYADTQSLGRLFTQARERHLLDSFVKIKKNVPPIRTEGNNSILHEIPLTFQGYVQSAEKHSYTILINDAVWQSSHQNFVAKDLRTPFSGEISVSIVGGKNRLIRLPLNESRQIYVSGEIESALPKATDSLLFIQKIEDKE